MKKNERRCLSAVFLAVHPGAAFRFTYRTKSSGQRSGMGTNCGFIGARVHVGDPIKPYRPLREELPRETVELMDAVIELAAEIYAHRQPTIELARDLAASIARRERFDPARTAALVGSGERLAARFERPR